MRPNYLRQLWKERTIVNGWISSPSAFVAELMAHADFDSLTIDMQHGLADYSSMLSMLQAINTTDVTPLVRVPWNEPGIIMRTLDAGSYGIICPMVNDYGSHANTEVLVMAMIETAEALSNLDDILSVPGLDGIYIGPADLSISLGAPANVDPTEPRVVEAIATILTGVKARKLIAGIHTGGAESARARAEQGFNFVTIASDARLLSAACAQAVAHVKGNSDARGVRNYADYILEC